MFESIDSAPVFQEQIIRQASLSVCRMAEDTEDARILLDMLGLHEDKERFPSWIVTPSANRRAPSTGAGAPLPPSRYGGVVPAPPT